MLEGNFDWDLIGKVITFSIAVLGAILGVLNTWNSMNQRKVKLRVVPAHAIIHGELERHFMIEVLNLSSFPVVVSEVGFTLNGNSINKNKRAAISRPELIDGGSWPRKLEPRTSVGCYFKLSEVQNDALNIGKAYASTQCGEARYGISPALKQIIREA